MMSEKEVKRKKQTKSLKWAYRDRPALMEQFNDDEGYIHLKYGDHFVVSMEDYSIRKISKIQKQLRQFLYSWLVGNNLPTSRYIVNIDCPETIGRNIVYLELQAHFAVPTNYPLGDNKKVCEELIEKMIWFQINNLRL